MSDFTNVLHIGTSECSVFSLTRELDTALATEKLCYHPHREEVGGMGLSTGRPLLVSHAKPKVNVHLS